MDSRNSETRSPALWQTRNKMEWLGEEFDPEAFDLENTDKHLPTP
jgi:hypothetical protein